MTVASTITRLLGRSPLIAAVLYLAAIGLFVFVSSIAILDITDQVRTAQQTSEVLEQLRSREGRAAPVQASAVETNPFLEGPTLNVASAGLLQRVSGAITAVGGSVQSSQVDITTGGKDGIVGLLINFELEQPALQKLLFDLETGSPLLIIDQIDIQTPQSTPASGDNAGQLRISLNASGRWRGPK
jgi:general secretion pathway protein M